jgi:hypothetical protein
MSWQALTGMYFRMAVGYTGEPPREFEQWPINTAFANSSLLPDAPLQLKAFMAAHDVSAVVAADSQIPRWGSLLAALDPSPTRTGGVTLYRPAASEIARYRGITATEMAQHDEELRFQALLAAARAYLAAGNDPSTLSPQRVQTLGLIPNGWVNDPDVRTNNGLYLGPWSGGKIAVGVVGSYDTLKPLIARYRASDTEVLYPFPKVLTGEPDSDDTFMRLMVIVFDRNALQQTAASMN